MCWAWGASEKLELTVRSWLKLRLFREDWGVEEFSLVHTDHRKVYLVLPIDVESAVRQDQAEDKKLGIFIIEMEFKAPDWIQSLGSKRDRREWGVQIPGESTFH